MQFKFDANQEFQIHAIESVADLFEGQPRIEVELKFAASAGFAAIANRLDLDDAALLKNLQAAQTANDLPTDSALQWIESEIETVEGVKPARFANFSVEMETGTGKTYVYIRTTLELFRRYGLRKFIVVVPSVAVREGVLKTLEITEKHLRELYDNIPYRYYAYDSDNLSQVRQFALSDGVEMMVMTIDSFNKASNVIAKPTDRLQGETPIHLVQATRPILILDEPQNMESELRVRALSALDPLFALRYSATHRNPYNLVYRLTPFEAYRQGLVKRIEVAGVEQAGNENQVFLRLDGIKVEKKTFTARLAVHKLMKDGTVKEQVVTLKPGDSLEEKANRPEYAPFAVEEINAGEGYVRFANGIELKTGETRGADKQAIFDAQIRYTLGEHFRKQERLRDAGIKVLSLFFIDRVDNYARADGVIRQLFDKAFAEMKPTAWRDVEATRVQAAYFAARRTKSGEVIYEDSKTGESEKDKEAYDLIMRDKERLLSFDEPTCFIFSHSALREGWDSPNVFQICTLNQTASEMKKRQEIGRGVRLSVTQGGDRVRDDKVNVLTVVANESYEKYVARYQSEIEDEFGAEGLPPPPANARKRGSARLRKEFMLKPEFKELWERIKHKTRYDVKIDTEKLICDVVAELATAEISPPRLVVSKARVEAQGDEFTAIRVAERATPYIAQAAPLPNIVEVMASLMERTTPPMRLTRQTLLEIFSRAASQKQQAALDNPYEFATVAVQIIKRKLTDQLVDGIQYERINAWYEMTQFELEIQSWAEYLIPAPHSLYDNVIFESDIEKEFVNDLENHRDDVKLYVKLPAWFTVDTPIGTYNPDWAIVIEPRDEHGQPTGEQMLYLVRETKSTTDLDKLRPDEARKIRCGERHFKDALGVNYKVVTNARDIL
ncbi:MAG: DEAD/DEAH box helicase family protein [Anaerolineales bacterium]|nr:DEAD/DEAH box helicase family protein [Anaerolineales bacterium]